MDSKHPIPLRKAASEKGKWSPDSSCSRGKDIHSRNCQTPVQFAFGDRGTDILV